MNRNRDMVLRFEAFCGRELNCRIAMADVALLIGGSIACPVASTNHAYIPILGTTAPAPKVPAKRRWIDRVGRQGNRYVQPCQICPDCGRTRLCRHGAGGCGAGLCPRSARGGGDCGGPGGDGGLLVHSALSRQCRQRGGAHNAGRPCLSRAGLCRCADFAAARARRHGLSAVHGAPARSLHQHPARHRPGAAAPRRAACGPARLITHP